MKRILTSAVVAMTLATSAACGLNSGSTAGDDTFSVGILSSYSGVLSTYGPTFEEGFRAGLDELTDGTNEVDGTKIDVVIKNDNADPATGVSGAKELLGKGVRLIVGTASSSVVNAVAQQMVQNDAVFIPGVTASVDIRGMGAGVFRAGIDSDQQIAAVVESALATDASSLEYLGQDYAYGQDQSARMEKIGAEKGLKVSKLLLPPSTQDFTAGVAKALSAKPDVLYVGWAGNTGQLYNTLAQQGAFDASSRTKVMALVPVAQEIDNLAAAVGDAALPNFKLISTYGEDTTGNDQEKLMLKALAGSDVRIDTGQAAGWLVAQMLVKALKDAGTEFSVDDVNKSLSGASFDSVLGHVTIRSEDHLLLAPAFEYRLIKNGDHYGLQLAKTYPPETIAPPVTKRIGS